MRVAVFGTGGVGGYFGARLAQAGVDVTFIARGDHLQAIRTNGLRLESGAGDVTIAPAQATDTPADAGPVDIVLLGVKSWQVRAAAEGMRPLLGPDTFVVPLQNGVDAPGQLAEALGPEHVVGGLCALISWIEAPGVLRHTGAGASITFGELDGSASTRMARLEELFASTVGVAATVAPDIHAAMWNKFAVITPWSGIGAITRAPMDVVRSIPETYNLLVRAVEEVAAVAQAQGVALGENIVPENLERYAHLPAGATASLQRDIMAGRPSELHDQIGAVVRIGLETGVDTPVHAFIYHSLLPLELQARERAERDRAAGG